MLEQLAALSQQMNSGQGYGLALQGPLSIIRTDYSMPSASDLYSSFHERMLSAFAFMCVTLLVVGHVYWVRVWRSPCCSMLPPTTDPHASCQGEGTCVTGLPLGSDCVLSNLVGHLLKVTSSYFISSGLFIGCCRGVAVAP